MLKELAKSDKKWREFALKICGDKDLADDLTNDMYLKLSEKKEPVNASYVYLTLKSIFYDYLRKQKEIEIEEETDEIKFCNLPEKLIEALSKLTIVEREVILMQQETSFRKTGKHFGINYSRAYYHYKKGMEKLSNNKELKAIYDEFKRFG